MDKWHWKKQSSGERYALVTASDEMVLYSWCDDCGEHGIAGADEAFALIEAAPELLAACEAEEAVIDHNKSCSRCWPDNKFCNIRAQLVGCAIDLRQAAIAAVANV